MLPFMAPPDVSYAPDDPAPVIGDMGPMQMMDFGPPSVSLAAIGVGLLGLKFFTESNLLTLNPQELKISVHNILAITFVAIFGIVSLKVIAAKLLASNIVIPGFNDLMGAV